MTNKIQSTPVRFKSHSSKGLIQHYQQANRQCLVEPNGTLWVLLPMNSADMQVMRSTTNGFSWDVIGSNFSVTSDLRSSGSLPGAGPLCNILFHDLWNYIDFIYAAYDAEYIVYRARADKDVLFTGTPVGGYSLTGTVTSDNYLGFYQVDNSRRNGFIFYPTESNLMKLKVLSNTGPSEVAYTVSDEDLYPFCALKATEDSGAYCVYTTERDLGGGSSTNAIVSKEYIELSGWEPSSDITTTVDPFYMFVNIRLETDSYGNLICIWDLVTEESSPHGASCSLWYSISKNRGVTWSTPTEIELDAGQTYFSEGLLESEYCTNPDVIGGVNGGFFMCYTAIQDSYARVFVRTISTEDGETYTLGDAKEIGTNNYPNKHITGGKFFKPVAADRLDISNPGLIRLSYSVGIGAFYGGSNDSVPVTIAQELLNESAYPETLPSNGDFITDEGDESHYVVNFNSLGGPIYNIDYYEEGLVGSYTDQYKKALNKIGVYLRFLQFEPIKDSLMSDISAYESPTEHIKKILIDPQSYDFPTPQISAGDTTAWIEQDIRKIFLPPDFFLSRSFLVNEGGYLKRTVWLVEYNGNQYEISQVVPRFLNTQLCFYEANVYVVGPSRDPFSRVILPSET